MSEPVSPRVLVTRSEPGASETAGRLQTAGLTPIVEPLFAIAPIDAAIPPFDALAFTSANGVRQFARLESRRDVPVFCVGARTAEAAREAGFTTVASADGDVHALAALLKRQLTPGARLLHVGNQDARGDLAGQLVAAGHQAAFVPLFRAIPVTAPGPALAACLAGQGGLDAILIHSPRAGAVLADFAGEAGKRLRVAAISQAAAAPLLALGANVEIGAAPDEPALISALARLVFG